MTWQKRWAVVCTTPEEIQKAVEDTRKGLTTRIFSLAGCSSEPETANWREGPPPVQESNADKYVGR